MQVLWTTPPHPATLGDDALLSQCDISKQRTSGPGGQHRNKVETAVNLLHEPTGVEASAGERRSVRENRPMAVRRLRLALAVVVRCPVHEGDQRSTLWRGRCDAKGHIACNPEHHDYPAMLAEAMDNLWSCELDPKRAAMRLGCSTSQLVRLVKDHPPAMVALNAARAAADLHALR